MTTNTRFPLIAALALALAAGAPPPAGAQAPAPPGDGLPGVIGPDDAVRIALANHPLLDASAAEVEAAEMDKKEAGSGYLPRIDLSEDFVRSTNPVFVFASKLGQENFTAADFDLNTLNSPDPYTNSQFRVTLMQNIWDGGRTGHGNKATAAGIESAKQSLRRTEDQVAFGAIQAFWQQAVAEEMLGVAREAEEAASANVALASELVEAGLAVASDLMSAEVRLAEIQAMRIQAEQGVLVAQAALRQALGLEGLETFTLNRPDEPIPLVGDSLMQRQEDALAGRPDLRALEQKLLQAEQGVKIANGPRLPQFGFMAQYEVNGEQFLGADGTNWSVGLGIRYRLFDGTAAKARVSKSRAQNAQLAAMVEAMRQGVRLEVQAAWAERVAAEQRLEVAAATLNRSAEALRIVRDRYGEGMAVMVELLAAEAAHTKTQADHAAAQGGVRVARALLDLASGQRGWQQDTAATTNASSLARLAPRDGDGDGDGDEIR
jgi:outer membrane protein TolC